MRASVWRFAVAQGFTPAVLLSLLLLLAAPALATERYAVVISGASGGGKYAESCDRWRTTLVQALQEKLGFDATRLIVMAEQAGPGVETATRENVRRALADLRRRLTRDDLLLIVLIGHGTFDGESAKFNTVGPDLNAAEWTELLKGMPGRLAFVNTTGSSFPFVEELSGHGRVIITATDSAAQRFDTIFPEFFVRALDDDAADLDKNGRVSLWEAFAYASAGVRGYYEQRGQLSTERPVVDDNGDKLAKEAEAPGPDGTLARATYLDSDTLAAVTSDASLAALHRRRSQLEAEVEALKASKPSLPLEKYEAEFERLMIELAKVWREIRKRS